MAQADATKFLEKFMSDRSMRARMKATKDDAERKKIASDLGLSFTKEELEKAFKASKELSDAELDSVAGGGSAVWIGIGAAVVGGVTGAVGAVTGAVAATAGVIAAFATCGW